MYATEYTKQDRAAPAVLAIAVNFTLLYLLAAGLGVVPTPLSRTTTTLVDVYEDTIKPIPVENQPINPRALHNGFEKNILLNKPDIEIEPEIALPPTVGKPLIDSGIGDPSPTMVTISARVLKSSEPPYPSFSRLSGEEGTVFLKVSISPYGVVGDVQVQKSSGFPRLDEAALKAIRAWRFAPAMRGTQAIATWVVVPVKYVLSGRA